MIDKLFVVLLLTVHQGFRALHDAFLLCVSFEDVEGLFVLWDGGYESIDELFWCLVVVNSNLLLLHLGIH